MCIAALTVCCLILLLTNSSLVADGSYYVLRGIQTGGPFGLNGREGINLVREVPLLLAVHAGVTNTHVLTVLEGVGFLVFPVLVWILALVRSRDSRVRFTLVALACGLCFATMIFFSVSELTLALPLVVLASVLLTEASPWSGARAALAIVATGFLFFSHEAIIPCAVVLVVTAIVRIKTHPQTIDRRASIVIVALSLAVLGGSVCTLLLWPNPNSSTFLNVPPSIVFLFLGAIALMGWIVLHGRAFWLSSLRWVLLVLAVLLTFNGIRLAIHDGPLAAYWTRGSCVTLVVALQLLLLGDCIIRLRGKNPISWPLRLPPGAAKGATAFLVALLIIPTVCALRWSSVVSDFRQTVTQHHGVIPATAVPTSAGSSYLWDWTNTTMSVILRSSTNDAIVENTTTDPEPFSPESAQVQVSSAYRWNGSGP